jgi:hypothetical protein
MSYADYLDYKEQVKFRKEKLILRIQQSKDIKTEILEHIKNNKMQFTKFMEDLVDLESNGDLYHLEYHYNKHCHMDIIECQMAILDDEVEGIRKMVTIL